MRVIDLSQTIEPEMPRFSDAFPKPAITPWMSHAQAAASGRYQDCTCEISQVSLVTSLGTYLDSPYHFDPEGASIEALSLEQLVLPGVAVDSTHLGAGEAIQPSLFAGLDLGGKAVLFHTGWSRHWGSPGYYHFPFLSGESAIALLEGGARLVGVDCLVVDNPNDPRRPAHVTLLHKNILIVENLTNLGSLPHDGFTFHAVPVKIRGAASFPVRAYAILEEK